MKKPAVPLAQQEGRADLLSPAIISRRRPLWPFTRVASDLSLDDQAAQHGPALWERQPDRCCFLRKVLPLRRFLSTRKAWITGLRRDQSPTRARTALVEWDAANGLVKRRYAREDVDAFAFYCPDTRSCYFLRFEELAPGGEMHLRLSPTLNNQARRVHWAREFVFGATLGPLGAVAQLGERRAGSAQAAGSSPAGSISDAASADAALL